MQRRAGAGTVERAPDEDLAPFALKEPPITVGKALLELPLLIGIAAIVAVIVKAFIAQAFFIPSESMEPTLGVGDRVVVSRLAYRAHEPNRGDVVVFHDIREDRLPDDRFIVVRVVSDALEALGVVRPDETELIKRIVALPGETVMARDNQLYVSGVLVDEPYIVEGEITTDFGPIAVPEEHYFMMGDNRDSSVDSRVFGPVHRDEIVGRAMVVAWPPWRASNL